MRYSSYLILFCLIFLPPTLRSEEVDQNQFSSLDEIVSAYYTRGKINGVIGVYEDNNLLYSKAVGMANYDWNILNSIDTKFRIGSITKQFTAALVLISADLGELDLSDTISAHLPYYRTDTGRRITIHQLLSNSSGIPNFEDTVEFMSSTARSSNKTEAFVKEICSGDLEFEPGTQFAYSSSGYYILGAILEAATNQSFVDLLTDRILEPLGLNDTGLYWHESIHEKRAQGYDQSSGELLPAAYIDTTAVWSAGAMYSTLSDLAHWSATLDGESLISSTLREAMFTRHASDYGYGWYIQDRKLGGSRDQTRVESHGGDIHGFSALIVREPENNQLVIILNNVFPDMDTERLANEVLVKLNSPQTIPYHQVPQSVLEEYDGIYALSPNTSFVVRADNNSLRVQFSSSEEFLAFPSTDTHFYYTVSDTQLTFRRDKKGTVSALVLHRGGLDDLQFPKLE